MIQVKREKVKRGKFASTWSLAAIFIGLYLLVIFSKGILEIRQAYRRIAEATAQLKALEKKRVELLDKKSQVVTLDYVEEVARNELNMQKEGERVVVIQKTQGIENSRTQDNTEEADLPNWRKWWRLIK